MEDVNKLVKKAADATTAHEAQQYAQAALNAAHAYQVMAQTEKTKKD